MNNLKGKTILVTGASSGIGKEVASVISKFGGNLIITGRNSEKLSQTFEQLNGENHSLEVLDLLNRKELENFCDSLPYLDGVVHCAGITSHKPAKFIKERHIQEVMEINFNIPVELTSLLLRKNKISKNASLVFLSSIATSFPYFGGSLYMASKSALISYAKALALELASEGIRSNCISPGFVKTPIYDQTMEVASEQTLRNMEIIHPLGFGMPQDVAGPICFLLSDQARWITGTNIPLGVIV